MRPIRRILVAVKNPDADTLPALDKAAQLARASGAQLELFHAISERLSADAAVFVEGGIAGAERRRRERIEAQLDKLARRLRAKGLTVAVTSEWDYPVYEAIVRQALRSRADLIVAECHAGRRGAPWLMHVTDWELLRTSPVPVLLVKTPRPYRRPVVLATLDPTHSFAKPTKLDAAILRAAQSLTETLNGTLHAMHAFVPTAFALGPATGVAANVAADAMTEAERSARRAFERELKNVDIPRSRQHLLCDVAVDAIPRVAEEIGAAIVVMGAVSRSGLKRVFIGNTAERVLNELPCDVLVVKPAKFVTPVARKARGARLVATPQFGAFG
jgi:universal stress protein E